MKLLMILSFVGSSFLLAKHASKNCGQMNKHSCEMFLKVNQYRKSYNRQPLKISDRCVQSAQNHAEDMVARGYFSHHSPDERYATRVRREGLKGSVAENIAKASTVERTFHNWINSRGHRRNILNAKYKYTGVGYIKRHWVQCFTSSGQ